MDTNIHNIHHNKPKKILWVVAQTCQQHTTITSHIASVRLRCLEILHYLGQNHPQFDFLLASNQSPTQLLNTAYKFNPSFIIFGKMFSPLASTILELAKKIPIILDICDDIYEMEHLKKLYCPLYNAQIRWITSSKHLQHKISTHSNNEIYLIEDAIEGTPSQPTMPIHPQLGHSTREPLHLVWFGNHPNIPALIHFLNMSHQLHINVVVITQLTRNLINQFETLKKQLHNHINVHLMQWSMNTQRQAILQAHCTIIPIEQSAFTRAKTANRLMTSLWLGTPVIANPIPSYQEFSNFCILAKSIIDGLYQCINTPWIDTVDTLIQSQQYIQNHYGINTIANRWADLFMTL